jgi:hypothetical protein
MNMLRYQENNSIHSSFKKFKYLGINLTKEVKDLHNEKYKNIEERNRRRH